MVVGSSLCVTKEAKLGHPGSNMPRELGLIFTLLLRQGDGQQMLSQDPVQIPSLGRQHL